MPPCQPDRSGQAHGLGAADGPKATGLAGEQDDLRVPTDIAEDDIVSGQPLLVGEAECVVEDDRGA